MSHTTSTDDDLGSDAELLREIAALPERTAPGLEPDRIGTRLGQFVIQSEIGRGAMGIVYAAIDVKLRRRVALKLLPASLSADPDRRRRFLREARAASAVTHPNIATVFEVAETEECVYIAMELVEGRSLRQHLDAGRLPVTEALSIATQIARGLARAHAASIVHRDLKPDNVVVGDDGLVKILDFGLAKPIGASEPLLDLGVSDVATAEGRILGTPSYMSPEQAKGKPVDARSDVFSFGVVLYEMLAGRRPFAADSTVDLLIAIDRDPPKPLTELGVELPRSLARVIDRCLKKQPADRYANCGELVTALESANTRPLQSARRVRATLLAAALLAVLAALAASASFRSSPLAPTGPSAVRAELPAVGAASIERIREGAPTPSAARAAPSTSVPAIVAQPPPRQAAPRSRAAPPRARPREDPDLADQK